MRNDWGAKTVAQAILGLIAGMLFLDLGRGTMLTGRYIAGPWPTLAAAIIFAVTMLVYLSRDAGPSQKGGAR